MCFNFETILGSKEFKKERTHEDTLLGSKNDGKKERKKKERKKERKKTPINCVILQKINFKDPIT